MRYRLITFLVFGAVLVGIGEWAARNHRLGSLDDWWLRFCVGNARETIADPSVTLVRIDRDYVPVFGDNFTRADYAAILGFVSRFEPKAVAFEPNLEFDETILVNQDALAPLKEAALILPELTLGTRVESGQAPENAEENVIYPVIAKVEGDIAAVPALTRTVAAADPQMLANGKPAFTAIELDTENDDADVLVPLVARQGDQLVPGFVLHSLVRHAGLTLEDVTVNLAAKKPVITVGERYTIPIDPGGHMKIYEHSGIRRQVENHPAPEIATRDGFYKTVSAFNLTLTGENDPAMQKLLADLQDEFASMKTNLVVIGDDHPANRHVEFANGEPAVSQAELLARAIATVQSGRYIGWWPQAMRILAAAVIFVLAILLFRFSRARVFGFGLLAALLYFFIVVAIFKSTLTWAPPFAQLALFGLLLIVGVILPDPTKKAAARSAGDSREPDFHDELGEEHEDWGEESESPR